MQEQTSSIAGSVGRDGSSAAIASLTALVNTAPGYVTPTQANGGFTFVNTSFSDQLLTDLKARLSADIAGYNTGLGTVVEAAMFARANSRVTDERATAYNEVTTQYSSRNFDIPPGALGSKQTEISNESSKRMADSSKDILHETAVLAQQYNLDTLKTTAQLLGIMGSLNDSQMLRNFEIQKVSVMQTLEAYKAQLGMYEVKGGLVARASQLSIETSLRTMTTEVEAFKGVAQAAAQMVASALNGVNVSSSFGFSGSEANATSKGQSITQSLSGKMAVDVDGKPIITPMA